MKLNTKPRSSLLPQAAYTQVIASARPHGSNERFANSRGEINANDSRELLARAIEIASRFATNEFDGEAAEVASCTPEERITKMREAIADKSGTAWMEIGSQIAAEITDTVARVGFMRQFLSRGELAQGAEPRFRVRHRNATSVIANAPSVVAPQMVRENYMRPAEFYIMARPMVEDREISQGSSDILAEKHMEALESIMVDEDRTFLGMADTASSIYNTKQVWSGGLTPAIISATSYQVVSWSVPATTLLMSIDLLQDIQSGAAFTSGNSGGFFSPVDRLEIMLTGKLGTLLGLNLMTDGFRNPRLRVVQQGTMYVFSDPTLLGAYTDRGPVQSEPVTPAMTGMPARGFQMSEQISMGIGNAYAVAKAQRS